MANTKTAPDCGVYGVEIVGVIAYTETACHGMTAYGKQRNHFEGSTEECVEYILTKKHVIAVEGVLQDAFFERKAQSDTIFKEIEDNAKRVCGSLWDSMSEKERCTAQLKSAITMIKTVRRESSV